MKMGRRELNHQRVLVDAGQVVATPADELQAFNSLREALLTASWAAGSNGRDGVIPQYRKQQPLLEGSRLGCSLNR